MTWVIGKRMVGSLWVGSLEESYATSADLIINVANELDCVRTTPYIKFGGVEDDCPESDISTILDAVTKAISNGSGTVFVHCLEGKSRSICCVIAYLCRYYDFTFEEAVDFIQSKREVDIYPLYLSQTRRWVENS